MKNVSNEYKTIAETLDGSARYYHQILVDGVELTGTIVEFKYSHTCNNSTNFSVGNTASAMVEFKIDEPSINLENKEIEVNQGLKLANGSMEYVKLGKFKVLSPEIERFQANYQCVDAMTYKMATVYESALTYPTTDITILEEICQQAGIELANTDLVAHTIDKKLDNYTKREMIGFIAQLQGKNSIINTDGKLELIWYTQTDYVVDDNRIYSDRTDIIKNENNYVLGYIKSTYGSKEIVSGDIDTQGIRITNPYMTQDILNEVFDKIKGLTFRAINIDFYGDFRLEVGDIVTVNTNNESYVVPIMTLEQSSDGGVVTTIGSIGETATQNSVDTNGSILNEIKRSVVNSETARSIAEQAADKISFVVEGDTASEFTVTENLIQATTEKLVIRTEKGGEVVIKDGIMYVDDIFAEEITATGTITGATLKGVYIESKKGKIGGFDISENALYYGTNSISSKEPGVYVGTDGIRTVSKDGQVTHRQWYSKYEDRPDNATGRVTSVGINGVSIKGYTYDGATPGVGIDFYMDDVLKAHISSAGIYYPSGYTLLSFDDGRLFGTADDSLALSGKKLLDRVATDTWEGIPFINEAGVMEVGKYIDFHTTDGNTADYDVRVAATTDGLTLGGTTTLNIKAPLKLTDDAGITKEVIQLLNPTPDSPATTGSELILGATTGGNIFIGGGEASVNLRNALKDAATIFNGEYYTAGGERTYISADADLYLYSDCNTVASRKALSFKGGALFPLINSQAIDLGKTTNPFNKAYINELIGNVTGGLNVQVVTTTDTDLNDYKKTGIYFFSGTYTPVNIPAGSNGWLIVMPTSDSLVKQFWTRQGTPNSNNHHTFERIFSGGVWSDWVRFYTTKDTINATSLSGKKLLAKNATDTWDAIPFIDDVGVMEVGKYIDFHTTDGNANDKDVRITASTDGLTLGGTTSGTFKGNLTGNASTATQTYGTLTNPSSATTYAMPFHASISSGNKSLLNNDGISYRTYEGTTSENGYGILYLGNSTAGGTAKNKYGAIRMFGNNADAYVQLRGLDVTSNRTVNFPDASGIAALGSDVITFSSSKSISLNVKYNYLISVYYGKFQKVLNCCTTGSQFYVMELYAGANNNTLTVSLSGTTLTIKNSESTNTYISYLCY